MPETVRYSLIHHPLAWLWGNIALIIFGTSALWYGGVQVGQITEQQVAIMRSITDLAERLGSLERHPAPADQGRRLTIVETRIEGQDRAIVELKADMTTRLHRIEDKLDRALGQ